MEKNDGLYYAHSLENNSLDCWQSLDEHLEKTAAIAKRFGNSFGSGDWAYTAGLWHDLGKYLPEWQSYMISQACHKNRALQGVHHSTAGALLSFDRFPRPISKILAYVIAGHHAGLPDWYPDTFGLALSERIYKDGVVDKRRLEPIIMIPEARKKTELSLPISPPLNITSRQEMINCGEHFHLWIRMLFSCVVDADFLDTEAFVSPEKAAGRGKYPTLEELSSRFDNFMGKKLEKSQVAGGAINRCRGKIFELCVNEAKSPPGIFSLTVPTGSGKTLSSMAFALKHALAHGKKRIIAAIPYTSIIEQTAKVYKYGTDDEKKIKKGAVEQPVLFGEDAVLEHHSNIDPEKETQKSRLASENWDAPIIITTNVQLFESLLAGSPSACRKLHNIANSVIILDEAQMLPPEYLKPILSVLRGLVEHFGVTVLICTATQPTFSGNIGSRQSQFRGLHGIKEIAGVRNEFNTAFDRVKISFPDLKKRVKWEEIAKKLEQHKQVLCVVNTRRDCRDLHALMPEGTVHLSANMCGEERSEVISVIKSKLNAGDGIRVVSTQLVEAGVDIDFPVVYRALAGMDSIVQAAGRCNREGKLNLEGKLGQVIVFQPPQSSPPGLLRKGEDAARSMLNMGLKEFNSEMYSEYFKHFYSAVNDFDKPQFDERLVREYDDFNFQFRTFAREVRLIDDTVQRGIIVWYSGNKNNSFELIDCLKKNGPEYWLLRKLQRFTVNVPLRLFQKLAEEEYIEEICGYWIQKCDGLYKPGIGLLSDSAKWDNQLFIA